MGEKNGERTGDSPFFLVKVSAKTKHWTASEEMLSRLDIEDERERENELSNLSTRPVDVTGFGVVVVGTEKEFAIRYRSRVASGRTWAI